MKVLWQTKTLGDVSTINYGHTESASDQPVGPKFLRITDIQNDYVDWDSVPYCKIDAADLPKYQLAAGDIVFARTGATTGKSYLINGIPKAVFASYLIRLRLRDNQIDPKFVSYFFQTDSYWDTVKSGSTGSAQGGFNASKLAALALPTPPLREQERIVAILDKAFATVATAKANTEKNLLNARTALDARLNHVFSHALRNSRERYLAEVCDFENGDRGANYPSRSVRTQSGIPFINAGHLTDSGIDMAAMNYISRDRFNLLGNGKIRRGDILFCLRGSLGKFASVGNLKEGAIASSLVIVRHGPEVLEAFILDYFRSDIAARMITHYRNGAAQPNLSSSSLQKFLIPVPPLKIQQGMADEIQAVREQTQSFERLCEKKLIALESLRRSLLQGAFSGEL